MAKDFFKSIFFLARNQLFKIIQYSADASNVWRRDGNYKKTHRKLNATISFNAVKVTQSS